ncbi:MAG: tetratricopeptide repeat protein [Chloroflexota bacterium]
MSRQFTLLGKLNIEENGRSATVLKSPKTCALLAYLIITNEVHSREAIADLLWESGTTTQSLTRLRVLLGRARKSVPGLVVTRQTVAFEIDAETAVDYQLLLERLQSTDSDAIDSGLQLYQGELLSGFYLPDAPRFNEWLLLERERLRYAVQTAYHKLCTAYQDSEAWEKGVAAAQRWLALNELDETALRWLMEFLAASGQVAVALQQYEHSRQRLWQELETAPEQVTAELAQQLTQLQEAQGEGFSWDRIVGAQVKRPLPGQLAKPGPLPPNAVLPYSRNQDFVGRKENLLGLADLLLPASATAGTDAIPTVAVTGMGGLGKTQLAVEFCYRYGRFYPGGVYWLSFAQADNVVAEVAAIGGERGMGLYREAERLTLKDQVGRVQKAWQEAIPRLLIFDNCEDEALLTEWVPKTGGCHILLTSRRGQWSRELGVEKRPLTTFVQSESLSLLKQLVPKISEADAQSIAAELGHLPLALHLAGSFLNRYKQINPASYLSQLQETNLLSHPSLAGRGLTYSPTGHELNVARTFALSFKQLDADNPTAQVARRFLAAVICFVPGEPIPQKLLLTAVVSDETDLEAILTAEDALAWLIVLGLVQAKGSETVETHRLVASAAMEILGQEEAKTAVEQAMVNWLNNIFQEENHLFTLRMPPVHLHHITDVALKQADIMAAQLSYFWGQHLYDVADYEQSEQYLFQALTIQQKVLDAEHPVTARTHRFLGNLIRDSKSDLATAQYHIEKALEIHESLFGENHLETAESLYELGVLYIEQGMNEAAYQALKRSLAIREKLLEAPSPVVAVSHGRLGAAYWYGGDFVSARPHFEKALHIQEQTLGVEHSQTAISYHSLGALYLELGDYKQAQAYLDEALRIGILIREPNHPVTALHRHLLGYTHLHMENYELAQAYFDEALATKQETLGANHPSTAATLNGLGELFVKMGSYDLGLRHLEEALAIRRAGLGENHAAIARSLFSLGVYYQAADNLEKAADYFQQALTIRENEAGTNYVDLAEVLTKLGEISTQLSNFPAAQAYLAKAVHIHETESTPRFRFAETLRRFGDLYTQTGDSEKAVAYYERALAVKAG